MANLKQDGKEVGEVFDLTIVPGGERILVGAPLGKRMRTACRSPAQRGGTWDPRFSA